MIASVIYARRKGNKGEFLWYDGKKFTNNNPPKYFGTRAKAKAVARVMTRRFAVLREFNVYVGPPKSRVIRGHRVSNPTTATREQLDEAARKLEDFSGHPARKTITIPSRSNQQTGLIIGELDLIGYQARRVGIGGGKVVAYDHDFRHGSRPLLAVTSDGKQLHIVGGRYEFTDAGIEDR